MEGIEQCYYSAVAFRTVNRYAVRGTILKADTGVYIDQSNMLAGIIYFAIQSFFYRKKLVSRYADSVISGAYA